MDSSSPGDQSSLVSTLFIPFFNPALDEGVVVIDIILILVFLYLSALMSAAEKAFFSFSYGQLKQMEKEGDTLDKSIVALLSKPKRLLSTISVSKSIFNLIVVGLTFHFINPHWIAGHVGLSFALQLAFISFLLLFFGEILPKVYATKNHLKAARQTFSTLKTIYFILNPLIKWSLESSSFLKTKLENNGNGTSTLDLERIIDAAEEENSEELSRDNMILKGIIKFGNISASQIMKSRMDVVTVDIETSFTQLLEIVKNSGYSRIPVFEGDFDKVIGIIYAKDLLAHFDKSDDFDWHDLIKPALYIPDSKKLDALLEEFQSKRVHMAIVVDEYGGTSGIVTLEDVLEEVIGEIKDEFDDVHEIDYIKIDDNNYLFEGKTAINDVCKVLGLSPDHFDEIRGDADSIAGLLLELKGELPQKNDNIEIAGFTFQVVEMNATRIVQVKVTIQ